MVILGLDPGIATVGFGLISSENGKQRAITYGAITTPAGLPLSERLESIYNDCNQLIESFQILRENTAVGQAFPIYQGRTVGNRKICTLWDIGKGQNPLLFNYERKPVDHLVLRITSSRGPVYLKSVKVYQ